MNRPTNYSRLYSYLIIDQLIKKGINSFFVSPGMRNAPLLWAIQQFSKANIYLGMDERAHAYMALGHAKANGQASVLICTSGTAMANYFPAVLEAKKSHTPLIVISADRPEELSQSDANQTIDQEKLFSHHVMRSLELSSPNPLFPVHALASSLCHFLDSAMIPGSGPIHLNVRFRDPLDQTTEEITPKVWADFQSICSDQSPQGQVYSGVETFADHRLTQFAGLINESNNLVIAVGALPINCDLQALKSFFLKLQAPLLLDITSSLKYDLELHELILPSLDHREVYKTLEQNPPQLMLHLGGRMTSKHYYSFLENTHQVHLVVVNPNKDHEDPAHSARQRFELPVDSWCRSLMPHLNQRPLNSTSSWREFAQLKREIIETSPLSYPYLSKKVLELTEGVALYIGNSTVIRSFDNYIPDHMAKNLQVFTNRGVSGIEGLVASAAGATVALQRPIVLILGDVSLFHDLNSLNYLRDLPAPLIVMVINNFGGGIFKMLPIAEEGDLIPLLTSPHDLKFKSAAEMFKVPYFSADDCQSFLSTYQSILQNPQSCVFEVFIDDKNNLSVYKNLKTVGRSES